MKKKRLVGEKLKRLFFCFLIILFFSLFIATFFNYSKTSQYVFWPILFFLLTFAFFLGGVERWKYKENNPYKRRKIKKSVFKRILTGLFAGVHYVHAIFTYNHRKYNTQVFYPETLECYIGMVWVIILLLYGYMAYLVSLFYGFLFLIVLFILILTNTIALFWTKKK